MADSAGTVYVNVKPLIEDDEVREVIREIVREELVKLGRA